MLRLERIAWSMVKWLSQATHEYAPPRSPLTRLFGCARNAMLSDQVWLSRYPVRGDAAFAYGQPGNQHSEHETRHALE